VIVYGAAQSCDKEEFLVELGNVCSNQTLPLLVGGDFNLLRFSSEKNKPMSLSKWSDIFNSIINTCALREIHMSSGQYTWSNNHADPTLEKLDRFLMSNSLEDLFPLVIVHKLVRVISDHSPLILDTLDIREKNRDFRFEKRWLREDNFLDRVQRSWTKQVFAINSVDRLQKKLKNVKRALKGWGANLRGADIKRKKDVSTELKNLEDIEEAGLLSSDQRKRKILLQQEMLKILHNEEFFWRQRSRENWLLQGDSNSAFFHRASNGCRRKRTIFSLKNGDSTIQGDAALLEHATSL
jgi:hypothetical protein